MSNCSNCYNGCTEIVSDKCVRYTGIDIPILGIQSGDSLSFVEQALITFLISTLDGSGIIISLPENSYCEAVTKNLPTCGEITATVLFEALVKTACDLQEQIDAIVADVAKIEAPYTVGCLTGVTSTSGTHDILQAVITKLCQLGVDLTALALDVDTNYVKLADLNSLIEAYLNSIAPETLYYTRMIPYTVVEYYGSLSNFDGTGAGTGSWQKIYLCNGLNGTPDKRGRVGVGVITGVIGVALDSFVNPSASPFNQSYSLGQKYGSNSIILDIPQMPAHTHATTAVILPNPHNHGLNNTGNNANGSGGDPAQKTLTTGAGGFFTGETSLSVSVTNPPAGESLPHGNTQPVLACYYIMYIP